MHDLDSADVTDGADRADGTDPTDGTDATAETEEMDEKTGLHALDGFENALIERFQEHPVLADINRLPDEDFTALLLQRRFVSLAFTPSYDLAIDLLGDEEGLRIARIILREEYPDPHGHAPSHREDMTHDLRRLGVSRQALAASRPTAATRRAITDTLELIADAGGRADADLRLLTFLRFWGEVLVSVEYGRLWERIGPLFTGEPGGRNHSRFYHPHLVHDAKTHSLATVSMLSDTHSDRLAARVTELLSRTGGVAGFKETQEQALRLKAGFYDQFLPVSAPVTTV
ncbi:hypothetical protein OTB20_14310 [Streptomyces sp. H27-H1]|uniref:hypothetical protein n=1 Tax=Streptomyces sp. H27-H1 TaxID=2996461 RepID=UPI00227204E0|nr:hypothetical protein [Streptomyces sp. H27-H1]MCY0927362.1 hypothetical protein [Streptomyces sp. H27-H1]